MYYNNLQFTYTVNVTFSDGRSKCVDVTRSHMGEYEAYRAVCDAIEFVRSFMGDYDTPCVGNVVYKAL